MRNIIENISDNLKTAIGNQISNTGVLGRGSDAVLAANEMIKSIPSTNEEENSENIIKKPIKTMKVRDLVRKSKIKKPIGKVGMMLPIVGEDEECCDSCDRVKSKCVCKKTKNTETKEATGAGSAGGFNAPLFSEPKRLDSMFRDEQPKKKVKGGFVYEDDTTNNSKLMDTPVGGKKQDEFKKQVEEKWSEKYKRSIDCNNPKGFSQRAHCQGKNKKMNEESLKGGVADKMTIEDIAKKHIGKYSNEKIRREKVSKMILHLKKQLTKGVTTEMEHTKNRTKAKEIAMDHLSENPNYYDKLKKIETKEATTSVSSGQYSTPKMWAKSTNKKDWRGASKTQIPGGKFVQVKKKCKKFPYCNQGDINALNLFENEMVKKVITKISKEHNISENVIKNILSYEYENIKKDK